MDQFELDIIIQSTINQFRHDSKKLLIAGNWKMNFTAVQGKKFLDTLQEMDLKSQNELIIFPPFTTAATLRTLFEKLNISTGLQNMHWESNGAWTGEISPEMVCDTGCKYVLLGHSERREHFGETDEQVARKVLAAQHFGIHTMVCVGENRNIRESGQVFEVLTRQLIQSLKDATPESLSVAYEPIWAIGTGLNATKSQITETLGSIRNILTNLFGSTGANIPLLYGGSVKPENVNEMKSIEDLGGLLIGGASLKAESFAAIIQGMA